VDLTYYFWVLYSKSSASSAVIRLDGNNRINPWVTPSRGLSVGSCTISAKFRSSFDISQSLGGVSNRFYGGLICLPFSTSKSWLVLIRIAGTPIRPAIFPQSQSFGKSKLHARQDTRMDLLWTRKDKSRTHFSINILLQKRSINVPCNLCAIINAVIKPVCEYCLRCLQYTSTGQKKRPSITSGSTRIPNSQWYAFIKT
jgi:hypothetical protein